MMESPRVFVIAGNTTAAIEANLKMQVDTRLEIRNTALALLKSRLGFPDGISETWNPKWWDQRGIFRLNRQAEWYAATQDILNNPREYKLGCNSASFAVMLSGIARALKESGGDLRPYMQSATTLVENRLLATVGGNGKDNYQTGSPTVDWIIGDWGYIRNAARDHLEELNFDDRRAMEDTYAAILGENIIFLGDGKWWGHPGGLLSLDGWYTEIRRWEIDGYRGDPRMTTQRTSPGIGLERVFATLAELQRYNQPAWTAPQGTSG